jgi:hypothetical protein
MSIAVGSLSSDDQRALEELDLLPEDSDEEESEAEPSSSALAPAMDTSSSVIVPSFGLPTDISRSFRRGMAHGIPWFEEMVEGSRLGRVMRARRGMGVSDDQSTSFEWEISEWHDDGTGGAQDDSDNGHTGKRKRGQQVEAKPKSKRP